MDIKDPRLLKIKGFLFLILALLAGGIVVRLSYSSILTLLFLGLTIWASCRFYYFAFYVLHHYANPNFKYAGLGNLCVHLLGPRKGKTLIVLIALSVITFLVFVFGPSLIHTAYFHLTPQQVIEMKKEEYRQLDRIESTLAGSEKEANFKRRLAISDFLYVRGIDIDGGDELNNQEFRFLCYQWKILFTYWGIY